MSNARNSSYELMRIFAMFMIVVMHGLNHAYNVSGLDARVFAYDVSQAWPVLSLMSVNIIAVNLFVLITGYFLVNLRWRTIVNLFLICAFYQLLNIGYNLSIGVRPGLDDIVALLTFTHGANYWFIRSYVVLVLMAPILNVLIRNLTDRGLDYALVMMLIVHCGFAWLLRNEINYLGFNASQFVLMYLVGAWLRRRQPENWSVWKVAVFYLLFTAFTAAWAMIFLHAGHQRMAWFAYAYNSPGVIGGAVCVFALFSRIKLQSVVVNSVAKSVIAIYFIESGTIGAHIYKYLNDLGWANPAIIAAYVVIVFAVALTIDRLRLWICTPITNRLSSRLDKAFPLNRL